jgi:hypothetical protein
VISALDGANGFYRKENKGCRCAVIYALIALPSTANRLMALSVGRKSFVDGRGAVNGLAPFDRTISGMILAVSAFLASASEDMMVVRMFGDLIK